MASSYAALLSLFHTLNHIKNHPRPPISLDQNQVESLSKNLTFFQHFLECRHSSEEEDDNLERRIQAAAYAAEDVIETHIVDQIHAESNLDTVDLSQGLERVIQDMDLIKIEVMEIKKAKNIGAQNYDHPQKHPSVSTASGRSASAWQNSIMVDDDLLTEVLDELTGQRRDLQIISVVGMGGIGKTTFARNIYKNPLIVSHFDILVWVTISQEYSVHEIILEVLSQEYKGNEMSEHELGERVHKTLCGRRFFIVMDDIWSNDPWDRVKSFFPNNNNGSRIMITTRLSNLALELSDSDQVFQMDFLDEGKSWNLLCEMVFGKELDCPIELENIGKVIARNCRGLPLSIVVIGGILKKSDRTQTHWEHTLQNMNSLINLEDGEYCLQLLRTSYNVLPIHLKPCFLYMGVFPEDYEVHVSNLIKLWVGEGILRPIEDRRLEEVAEEYIEELIDRNLIIFHEQRWNGKAKICKIHDLLRDLCLREAQKQRFLRALKHHQGVDIPQCMNVERRICIHRTTQDQYSPQFLHALESASLARSLILTSDFPVYLPSFGFRMLRVYSEVQKDIGISFVQAISKNTNLRCLIIDEFFDKSSRIPSSWMISWNAQTLKVDNQYCTPIMAPSEIWEMPLLRHVIISKLELPDPVCGENDLILEDLLTLACVKNFKLSKRVIKRIPNLKTLKLYYELFLVNTECLDCSVNNFGLLKKLQSLNLSVLALGFFNGVYQCYMVQNLSLPRSLKKLTLRGTMLKWEECTTIVGTLPLLEFLKLDWNACCGTEWETVEGQFCSLTFLQINECELRYWRTDNTHFPCLEHLILLDIKELEEIPLCIGDIPTLELIELENCSECVKDSAKRIEVEQLELGNEDLQIIIYGKNEEDEEEDQTVSDGEERKTISEEEEDEEEDQTVSDGEERKTISEDEENAVNKTCIINLGKGTSF